MYSKANKVLSIAMSAAILLTNMMTPMTVYADEVNEPAQDLESEMPSDTEPVSYYLTLPYNEAVSYNVDENHVVTNDNSGNMDIRLAYHEEDKVEFAFQTDDTVQVMEIHLTDLEKQEYPFSIDDNRNITLFMPAKDLELTLIMEEIPVPDPVPETEQPAEPVPASETEQPVEPIPVPAAETEGTWEQPAVQEEGINAFDLTAQEVTGDQSSYIPEDLVPEDNQENVQADDADRNIADGTNMEDISTQPDPENGNEVASTETGEDPFDPVEETREIPEDGSGETAGEIDNPDTPGIALTAETEEDGLPTQGSILTAETLTIPLMDVDFIPETDFSNISFNPETDRIELVSDEVDITNPGTYSTIYRVTHNGGEKMWYVLRPVTVSEETSSGSPEISLDDEIPTDSLQEPAFPEEGVDASEELSVAEAFETEPATAVNEEEDQKELQEQIHPEEETEELQTEETENLSEEETEALTETETYESKIPSAITYGVWRTPDELISPTVEDENGNTDVYSVTVENHLEGTGVILSQEDGMYAAGSVVQASVTGNTGAGFIISVAAGDEVLFGTIDFGSEDPLPVYFYMPDGDVKIVLDGLSAAQIEAGVNEDGEEEIGIPFAGKMLKAAVNSSSLKQHTAADISYINFTSGEKAYFPNGYNAATMKTVVIYYKDGTNSGTRRAFCVDHYMGPPQSANGITNFSEESRMSKLMYFNFGGPGFDLKIGGESVKDIMNASGLTDEHHYQMMSHLILAWQYCKNYATTEYAGMSGQARADDYFLTIAQSGYGEAAQKIVNKIDKLSTSAGSSLSDDSDMVAPGGTKSKTFKWNTDLEENTLSVKVPAGTTLVTGGKSYPGKTTVTIKGGGSFYFMKDTPVTKKVTEEYTATPLLPMTFSAVLIPSSALEVMPGYSIAQPVMTSSEAEVESFKISVTWQPVDEGYLTVKKTASDGSTSYDFSGCHIGAYSDSAATSLVHEFVTKADGTADTAKVTPGTYYVKEISVPSGWTLNTTVYKITVSDGNVAASPAVAAVPNSRAMGFVEVQKQDADTGNTQPYNGNYSFAGMEVTLYSDAALTQAVTKITSDAAGYGKSSSLYYGTYYARETKAPAGYDLYDHTFTVVIGDTVKVDNTNTAKIIIKDPARKKPIEIQKQDADTGKEQPYNGNYSFAGMEVTLYSDAACTSSVTKITADVNGYGKSADLYYGKYYARETKAPSGYDLYDHTFTVVIGDSVSVDSAATAKIIVKDPAKKKPLEVQKVDKDTGKTEPFNRNYSFDRMEVTIYRDAALTQVEQVLTSSADGYVKSKDLYYGTYYVRETKPPKGYQLYDHTFVVDIGNELTVDGKKVDAVKLSMTDEIIRKPIVVQKYDKEKGTAAPNNKAVSFMGAEYTIYEDVEMTKTLEVVVIDESGKAESQPYPYETYYVKETKAPTGYLPDEIVYKVVIDDKVTVNGAEMDVIENKKAIVSSYEQVIRGSVSIMKYLDDAVDTSIMQEWIDREMLKGIEFTLTHEDETVAPVKIITDRFGHAQTDQDALVFGHWKISETAGTPEGYQGLDEALIEVRENGVTLHYVITNKKPQLQIVLYKKDALTGELIPISGAKFQIKDRDGNLLSMPDNLDYSKVTDTFTTNEEGIIAFTMRFEPGEYTVTEVEAPEGFLLAREQTVTLNVDDDVTVPFLCEVVDMPQRGKIKVIKKDADTDETLKEGFIFDVFTAEDIKDASGKIRMEEIDGETVTLKAGTKVDTITTGEDGTAITRELFLGSYKVVESRSAEYYAVDDTPQDVTLTYDKQVETVLYELPVRDEKTKFDLFKVDADTDAPLAGIAFRIFSTADVDAEKARQVAEAVEQLRAQQELEKQDLFEKQQIALDNLGDVTDERRAQFIASQAEELAAFEAGLALERAALEEKLMAELEITDISGLGSDYITDGNGQIHVEDLLHENTYFLYEIATLPGYNLDTTIQEFTVDEKGLIAGQGHYTVKLTNKPNLAEISKKDITGGNELPGARLTLSNADGEVIATWISEETPYIIRGLPAGIYTLKEEKAPEGYALAEDITFELTDSLTVQQVTMYDEQLMIHFSKKDITGEKELPGASLKVTDLAWNVIDEWISTGEEHVINLKVGKYVMTEVAPPEKYATAESIEFEVKDDMSVQMVEMKDAPIQVEISKKDITNGEELPGAHLQVLDVDGKVVEEWDSTTEPHMISLEVGTYTLVETIAPAGFATASVISFEVKDTAEIQKVDMFDDITRLTISKTDITTGEELPGAHLVLRNSEGKVIEEWVSTTESKYFEKLPIGTYTLEETISPENFGTAETIKFEVNNTTQIQKVEMKDAPLREVDISKVDITSGEELPGAQLTVTTKEGRKVDQWISTKEPHRLKLDRGTYLLTEEIAPDGYLAAETIEFEVVLASGPDDLKVQEVVMKDAPYREVDISKTDITNGKELPGAKLTVKNEEGETVETWVSTETPHRIKLNAGKYTLTEETAPDGYVKAETISFEVVIPTGVKDAQIQKVEMKDDVTKVEISKQNITTEKELPGAKLIIKDKKGREIESWTSTKEPHYIEKLPVGKYTLTEVTAPKGYDLAETIEFEVKDSPEVVHVKMQDKPKDELVDLTGKKKETMNGGGSGVALGTPGSYGGGSVISGIVKTGDYNRYLPAILLIVCGIAGLAGVFAGRKKKKRMEK